MLDAKELEIKKAGLGPLEDKDKVNWWTFTISLVGSLSPSYK